MNLCAENIAHEDDDESSEWVSSMKECRFTVEDLDEVGSDSHGMTILTSEYNFERHMKTRS